VTTLAGAGAAAHIYVPDVDASTPEIAPGDAHHLFRVLRIRRGEHITVGDGAGRWRSCTATGDETKPLEPSGPARDEPRVAPLITIGFALVKGDRPEWIVQKLTEMGVDVIVPVRARRCVVRWDPDQERKNIARLERVAHEASMQSRRAWLPVLTEVRDVVSAAPDGAALADPSGTAPSLASPTVLVGPEGGWDPEERAGAPLVSLGPQVLRAETAALVAGAVLCTLRAGLALPTVGAPRS